VRGNYGNQLWIAKRVARRLRLEIHELASTLMVAHGHAWEEGAKVPLAIIVAHGPHAKAPREDIESYYGDLDAVLADVQGKAKIIMLADLNATVGEGPRDPELIGGADPERPNLPGQFATEMAANHRLVVLNTFTPQPPTFMRGGRRTRLDYIMVSECLGQRSKGVRVRDDIDLRLSAERDHSIVQAEVSIDLEKAPRKKPPTWRLHKDALADPETARRLDNDLRKLAPPSVTWPLDHQLGYMVAAFREGAQRIAEERPAAPRKTWMSAHSWENVKATQVAKADHRKATCRRARAIVRVAWAMWKASMARRARSDSAWWADAEHKAAHAHEAWARHRLELRQCCQRAGLRWDRRLHAQQLADQAAQAADRGDSATLYRVMRRLTSYRPRAPSTLCWEDGTAVKSEEDKQRRWRDYYADLFMGKEVPASTGKHGTFAAHGPDTPDPDIPRPIVMDSEADAQRAWTDAAGELGERGQAARRTWAQPPNIGCVIRAVDPNKALGPDMTSSALYKAAPDTTADYLSILMARSADAQAVPGAWRGGRMASLPKKSAARACNQHRGLLVSDHTCKIFTAALAQEVADPVMSRLPDEQNGGVKGRGTTRAALTTRSFVDYCRRTRTPGAILFVDVRKAYDVVIREFLFGARGEEEDFERIVDDLGLPGDVAEHLLEFLRVRGGDGLI